MAVQERNLVAAKDFSEDLPKNEGSLKIS